jgi:LysR family glycine cleavage system transcriptional activator
MRQFRNVPPLQYLLGFEAAARLGSFGRAAEELGLTQSAISHQMRLLEERLGQPLFTRDGRKVRLTDAGRDYQRTVARSLAQLDDGCRRLDSFRKPGSVVIYAPRDFAARWLMPRLHLLRKAVPKCEPWLDSSGVPVDFKTMEISIAIARLREADPAIMSFKLMDDVLTPVMAPRLAAKPVASSRDLLDYTLLHDERAQDWSDWFAQAKVKTGSISAGLDFSDSDFALMAAELGHGVALASLPLAQAAIRKGQLVRPLKETLKTGHAWFALSTAAELADPVTHGVWTWLATQSAKD